MNTIRSHIKKGAASAVGALALSLIAHTADAASVSGALVDPSLFSDIPTFIQHVVQAIVTVALPLLSIAVVYAGFKFIAAQGKPEKLAEARRNFLFVMVGVGLVLGAWALVSILVSTVSSLMTS